MCPGLSKEGLCWLCSNFPGFSPGFPYGMISARSSAIFLWKHRLDDGQGGDTAKQPRAVLCSASDLYHIVLLCIIISKLCG